MRFSVSVLSRVQRTSISLDYFNQFDDDDGHEAITKQLIAARCDVDFQAKVVFIQGIQKNPRNGNSVEPLFRFH
jgi:hypothetical protein